MNIYEILEKEIGPKIVKYRKRWKSCEKGKLITKYPFHINFELTFGCNLKCEFCLHNISYKDWDYDSDSSKKISFEKYCEIIDEGVSRGLCSVEFNGINEPLLKNDIFRYISYAKEKGVLITSLHTNAVLLTPYFSKELINSGLTLIIFSVDAFNKETYEQIRKNNHYEKIISNIENFLKIKKELNSKFPLTKMSFSKNKLNYKELEEYKKYWENKVDDISVSSFCNPFIGKENYVEVEKKYRLEDCDLGICTEPFQRLLIRNNGDVVPCCSFFGGEIKVGNIYEENILKIWNGEKMNKVRENVLLKDISKMILPCQKCKLSMLKDKRYL